MFIDYFLGFIQDLLTWMQWMNKPCSLTRGGTGLFLKIKQKVENNNWFSGIKKVISYNLKINDDIIKIEICVGLY